jgi:hypothetical protein
MQVKSDNMTDFIRTIRVEHRFFHPCAVVIDDQFPYESLFSISMKTPWFVDIEKYLTTRKFPQHFSYRERCNIVHKSSAYTWVVGYFLKLCPDHILRRCIREDEVHDILHDFHDEPCGGHYAAKRIDYKILQARYYWPNLHRDAQQYTSHCDECQRMGKPRKRNEMYLQPQVSLEPFDKWGMDFIGPIDPPINCNNKTQQANIMSYT